MRIRSIELIARGVLVHDGLILLCQNRAHGHLFLPGGHVEFGERAAEALEREVREELGVDLASGRFLGACEASFSQPTKKPGAKSMRQHHELNLVFELSPRSNRANKASKLRPLGEHDMVSRETHIAFVWEPLDRILAKPTAVVVYPRAIVELIAHASALFAPGQTMTETGTWWTSDWK